LIGSAEAAKPKPGVIETSPLPILLAIREQNQSDAQLRSFHDAFFFEPFIRDYAFETFCRGFHEFREQNTE